MFKSLAAAYDKFLNAVRTSEINPLNQQYVSEIVAEVTSGPDGLVDYYVDCDGFTDMSLAFTLGGGGTPAYAITVYFANETDGDPSGLTYFNVTAEFDSSGFIDADMLKQISVRGISSVKVTVTVSGTSDDADYKITAYKQQG